MKTYLEIDLAANEELVCFILESRPLQVAGISDKSVQFGGDTSIAGSAEVQAIESAYNALRAERDLAPLVKIVTD